MARLGYKQLKKVLEKYHNFSFKTPRGNKDFTPQQKSAITRTYKKYSELIRSDLKQHSTFLKFPKGSRLKDIDGVRTNKGVFFPLPGAKVVYVGRKGGHPKYRIDVKYRELKEKYFPFPPDVQNNPDWIEIFVEELVRKYKPDYIMWATAIPYEDKTGHKRILQQRRQRYDPMVLQHYLSDSENSLIIGENSESFYVGVYLGWQPSRDLIKEQNKRGNTNGKTKKENSNVRR